MIANPDTPDYIPSQSLEDIKRNKERKALEEAIEKINKDEGMNDFEKSKAIESFKHHGHYYKSHTEILENDTQTTELINSDDKPLTDKEKIDRIDLNHLPQERKEKVWRLFELHPDSVASSEFDCPQTDVVMDVELKDGFDWDKTLNIRYNPVAPQVAGEVSEMIRKMEQAGILTECNKYTPIINNLLITRKKSGKIRVCFDNRNLNISVKRPHMVMTSTQEVFNKFSKADWVSSFDLQNAYFSCRIAESKIPLFSFFGPDKRRLAFTRAAQGFVGSASALETLMNKLTQDIGSIVTFADDLWICSRGSFDTHLEEIEKLLTNMEKMKVRAKAEKICIAKETIEVIGMVYSRGSFHIPSIKANSINQFKEPRNLRQCRGFLATCNYFRRYVHKFAEISLPIVELTRKTNTRFHWSIDAQTSFNLLKDRIMNSIAIYPPDFEKTFYATADSSANCSSFSVYQLSDTKETRWLGCSSRIFTASERNLGATKGEAIGIGTGF